MWNVFIHIYVGAADAKVLTSPSAGQSMTRAAVKWRHTAAESTFRAYNHRCDVHVDVWVSLGCIIGSDLIQWVLGLFNIV